MHKIPSLSMRVKILMLLKKIPMSSVELSKRFMCPIKDVEGELTYLEKEGKIEKIKSEEYDQVFWRLKK